VTLAAHPVPKDFEPIGRTNIPLAFHLNPSILDLVPYTSSDSPLKTNAANPNHVALGQGGQIEVCSHLSNTVQYTTLRYIPS
jgi:hypothetical protein